MSSPDSRLASWWPPTTKAEQSQRTSSTLLGTVVGREKNSWPLSGAGSHWARRGQEATRCLETSQSHWAGRLPRGHRQQGHCGLQRLPHRDAGGDGQEGRWLLHVPFPCPGPHSQAPGSSLPPLLTRQLSCHWCPFHVTWCFLRGLGGQCESAAYNRRRSAQSQQPKATGGNLGTEWWTGRSGRSSQRRRQPGRGPGGC